VAAFERTPLRTHVFWVDIAGHPRADHEIEEVLWYRNKQLHPGIKIGSLFGDKVIPFLSQRGLIG
jgi:8-oxo-dGTP diphosphatase